tara:strand:+ start:10858 stop:12801 length:1944 start_codon:yes stop_codon:yes gene_type:complete
MDPISRVVAAGAAGAGAAGAGLYVDDVFSTYLYRGTGSPEVIANGIDLSGEGGLVWLKKRTSTSFHVLTDTERGAQKLLYSNTSNAEATGTWGVNSFGSNGFGLTGNDSYNNQLNSFYTSWTFRKAPGFFDVVTYTGNGTSQNISHNLGSVPGAIFIKCTTSARDWVVYHRSAGATKYLKLNSTDGASTNSFYFDDTTPTASSFRVADAFDVNQNGETYVAYLFAHDDQSFGTGSDEAIIKCGSYTGNGSTSNVVTVGFEPQWLLVKRTDGSGQDWHLFDVMRGMTDNSIARLYPNTSGAESVGSGYGVQPLANGFEITASGTDFNGNNYNYIYIAIRRPHKPPELATDVFDVNVETEARTTSGWTSLSGFVTDAFMNSRNLSSEKYTRLSARLTGGRFMSPDSTSAEGTTIYFGYTTNDGIRQGSSTLNSSSDKNIDYHFRRAPGFFDVVAYDGTGSATTINHNLGVAPRMIIVKNRGAAESWSVYSEDHGNTKNLWLNDNSGGITSTARWNSTSPTDSVFSVGTDSGTNGSGAEYVAYLFGNVTGISKVGSYTGTGSNIDVNCGFTAGARFVMIKRYGGTGDWYVWDSTRGIVSGNDPYIELNTSDAEVTDTDYLDPLSAGFTVTSSAPAALNTSGGTYLFLAIA